MNILFSLYLNNMESAKTYTMVLDLLINSGHKVVVLCKKNKYIGLTKKEYEIQDDINNLKLNDFDLILATTNSSTRQLKNITCQADIPLIGLIDSSDYTLKKITRHNNMDKIVLLNPPLDCPDILLQSVFTNQLWIPAISPSTSCNNQLSDPKCPRIVVATEERTALLSTVFHLIPFLNKLLNFEITIVSEHKDLLQFMNSNIRISSNKKTDLKQIINKSDIVIASGGLAEQAVALGKPLIIAGERGYGGLLSEDIFEQQFQNQFQGRIGGTPGEFIPEKLLMENILDLLECGNDQINTITQANKQLLKKKVEEQKIVINKILQEVVRQHETIKHNITNAKLKLSDIWQIKLLSNEKFALLNIATEQIHCYFEIAEANIIELFREGCQVNEALNESGYSEEQELFVNFIRNLIDEKILVIDGNN